MTQPHRITTIAATVGTSLLMNLRRMPDGTNPQESAVWLPSQPEDERGKLHDRINLLRKARRQILEGRWEGAGRSLAETLAVFHVMGAEAASLEAILSNKRYPGVSNIHLLHSDTENGAGCAAALAVFLQERHGVSATRVRIDELDHSRPGRFRVAGLRNLVRAIATVHRECGGTGMLIDATGGYKAQTAVAAMTGQLFGVPVVYRFEEFRDIMEFPPLPVRLDLTVVEENLQLVQAAARGHGITETELKHLLGGPLTDANPDFARIRLLLEGPVTIDAMKRWALSPFGTALYERWFSQEGGGSAVLPKRTRDAVTPRWGAHHRAPGVEGFVDRLVNQCPWVTRVVTGKAEGLSHRADGVTFDLFWETGVPDIRCVFVRDNHPELLRIQTTAGNRQEQTWAVRRLIELFGE